MNVTWEDSEESSFDEEQSQSETTNMCFMAHPESEISDNESISPLSYDKLKNAFEELHEDFQKLVSKYKSIKKNYSCLSESHDRLSFDIKSYKSEIATLKESLSHMTNENKIPKKKYASPVSVVKPPMQKKNIFKNAKRPIKPIMHHMSYNAKYIYHACK